MLRHRLHLLTLSSALVLMSARTALAAEEAKLIVTSPRLGAVARPTLHLDISCTSGGSVVCTGIEVTILNYRGEYLQLSRSTQDRRSVDPEADDAQLAAIEEGLDRILTRHFLGSFRAHVASGRPSRRPRDTVVMRSEATLLLALPARSGQLSG